MRKANFDYTRRDFLVTAAAAAGATALPVTPARAAARYTRYNVTSPQGQKMLASYAKGVEAMLKLPADHPQNLVPQRLRPPDGLPARQLVVLCVASRLSRLLRELHPGVERGRQLCDSLIGIGPGCRRYPMVCSMVP